MTRDRLILAINAAELAGFTHYAASLRSLYDKQYGFHLVTGRDFGRANAWAKQQRNPVNDQIREHLQRSQPGSACMPVNPAKHGVLGTNTGPAAAGNGAPK